MIQTKDNAESLGHNLATRAAAMHVQALSQRIFPYANLQYVVCSGSATGRKVQKQEKLDQQGTKVAVSPGLTMKRS